MKMIPLAKLSAHPRNPRLAAREDIVDQIAVQLNGHMDEAHALIVRPKGEDDYEIISGHHRNLAAIKAGLTEVPCWVREMSDEDAYMALALNNAQSELHPLEIGMHALKSGLSVRAYAEKTGMSASTLQHRWQAATVLTHCTHMDTETVVDRWRHLAEIHAAPRGLWRAMVEILLEEGWTVEDCHKAVKKLKSISKLPDWANIRRITDQLLGGSLAASDVAKFAAIAEGAKRQIADAALQAEQFTAELDAALLAARPFRLSDVSSICQTVLSKQAELVRAAKEAEIAKQREQEEKAERLARMRRFISLEDWKVLVPQDRQAALAITAKPNETANFNEQTGPDIEWAQWSWNPVTGCLHDCPYCYARDIAAQPRMAKVYPFGFAPTLHPIRLLAPRSVKVPKEAEHDTRYRNVFTGSMADIFGRWVPAEWIEAILAQVSAAPQWNFLFLTKFPNRMAEFDIPSNAWIGTSIDLQARVAAAEKAFVKITSAKIKWLSVEPMLEPLKFSRLDLFDWVVIGGASRSTKTPEWKPPFPWIYDLVRQARDAGTRVYFKTNLLGNPARILELPFDAPIPADETQLPDVFRYLKSETNFPAVAAAE